MEVEQLTVPIQNPLIRRKLDIAQFEDVPSFGHDVIVTFHDWEWRGGNNSNVLRVESDTWESSLSDKGGHFKKQWLMKNTEETKQVPAVDEVVLNELRKRNVDLSTIEGLNGSFVVRENGASNTHHSEDERPPVERTGRFHSEPGPGANANEKIWQPFAPPNQANHPNQPTTAPNPAATNATPAAAAVPSTSQGPAPEQENKSAADGNKKGKKLSLADYKKRQMEERKRQKEEEEREEAERQRQQNNRLSPDAVTAVLSSAVAAATNGSRVQTVTSSDVAWLSSLVGMNLSRSPNSAVETSLELTQSTAERLSDLAQATEQVLNTVRAANVLAALHAQNRYRKMN